MVWQYVVVAYLVIVSFFLPEMLFTPGLLVVFLSLPLPMFFKVVLPMYRHPRPAERPEDYPAEAWPLWFVASASTFARRFGMLFLGGLMPDTILQLLILPLF